MLFIIARFYFCSVFALGERFIYKETLIAVAKILQKNNDYKQQYLLYAAMPHHVYDVLYVLAEGEMLLYLQVM